MIVDIHAYIGKWPYWPVAASAAREVIGVLDSSGIDTAAICSTRSLFVNWEDGNTETAQAMRQFPKRLMGFACLGQLELSHTLPREGFNFDSYSARGFRGCRLYPQHHSYHLLYENFVDRICEEAKAREWPVLLPLRVLMNWGAPSMDLAWMVALVERHPRTPWILAGINYFHELRAAVSLMLRHSSVHLETSCVQGFHAIEKLVRECGSERLLFGSGAPLQNAAAGLQKVLHARISDADRERILCQNARRLLRLEEHNP
ncbi:MAG: amidohydrolase family protein [Terriglobia bacterium]